jgi:hypothetical protein
MWLSHHGRSMGIFLSFNCNGTRLQCDLSRDQLSRRYLARGTAQCSRRQINADCTLLLCVLVSNLVLANKSGLYPRSTCECHMPVLHPQCIHRSRHGFLQVSTSPGRRLSCLRIVLFFLRPYRANITAQRLEIPAYVQ